jgi:hypothetical protein
MNLSGLTNAQAAAISDKLSTVLRMPNIKWLMEDLSYSLGVSGDSHVSFPGLENIDIGGYLPDNQEVGFDQVKMTPKETKLIPMNKAYGVSIQEGVRIQKATDIQKYLAQALQWVFPRTIFAGILEYITNNPGKWGVLPSNYDCTAPDGQPLYSNSGWLDNIRTYSGGGVVDVMTDYWELITQILNASYPGSEEGYWDGADTDNLQPVIIYPPEHEQVMKYVFTTEYFNNIVKNVTFNSEGENVLARTRPILRRSKRLSGISTTDWMVFLTTKAESDSKQPLNLFFNNAGLSGKHDSENNRRGIEVKWDNGSILSMAVLGPGSTYYETKRKYGISMNWYMGIYGDNRFRTGIVKA